MEELNLDKKARYLIQDEQAPGQKLEDRIYLYTPVLAAKKDMQSFNPVTQTVVNSLKTVPEDLVAIELNGVTFNIDPELHKELESMAVHMEMLESQVRVLEDEKNALSESKNPELVGTPNTPDDTIPSQKLESPKARKRGLDKAKKVEEAKTAKKGKEAENTSESLDQAPTQSEE